MKLTKKTDTLQKTVQEIPAGHLFELADDRSNFAYLVINQQNAKNVTNLGLANAIAVLNLHTNILVEIEKDTIVKPLTSELIYSY